jgi:hypothetical protein
VRRKGDGLTFRRPVLRVGVFGFSTGSQHQCALGFFGEDQLFVFRVIVHVEQVAGADLLCGDQAGNGVDQKPLDGALEMPRPVFQVNSFVEQEALGFREQRMTNFSAAVWVIRSWTARNSSSRIRSR